MIKMKNNLDERQEQALLQIEHKGCWLAFWGLLIVLVVEFIICGYDFKVIAGEWVIFMILSIYLCGECLKKGIWDRHLQPNAKTNFWVSVVSGVATAVIMGLVTFFRFPQTPVGALATGLVFGIAVFVLVLISLTITVKQYEKVLRKQEEEPNEEEL